MGNREQLLDAAKRCLFDKGYQRTTVRDICDQAEVSKAAIGYHFGSKERLLNTALFEVLDSGAFTTPSDTATAADEPAVALWTSLIDSFRQNETFWLANLEAVLVANRDETVREQLAEGMRQARSGIVAQLTAETESQLSKETVRTLGSVQLALISGLLMQHLTSPDDAPAVNEVGKGIKALAALLPDDDPAAPHSNVAPR